MTRLLCRKRESVSIGLRLHHVDTTQQPGPSFRVAPYSAAIAGYELQPTATHPGACSAACRVLTLFQGTGSKVSALAVGSVTPSAHRQLEGPTGSGSCKEMFKTDRCGQSPATPAFLSGNRDTNRVPLFHQEPAACSADQHTNTYSPAGRTWQHHIEGRVSP
jgi:hypothetical protein